MASKVNKQSTKKTTPAKKSRTTGLDPVTPGELLREEFLVPMEITAYRLAKEINVPPQRIGEILKGKRTITPDTDLRLSRFFGLTDGYWLRVQSLYDVAIQQKLLAKELEAIKPWPHNVA